MLVCMSLQGTRVVAPARLKREGLVTVCVSFAACSVVAVVMEAKVRKGCCLFECVVKGR